MRLILVGPPGSGKGTQAKLLSQRLGLAHIATGDILREAGRLGTPAGRKAAPFMANGQLVPDDLVNEMVADLFRREDRPDKFVFDGYPRTMPQAAALDPVLRQQFLNIERVVVLRVDDEEIVRRVSGRWICPLCQTPYHTTFNAPRVPGICDADGSALVQRADDKEATVRDRLGVYHGMTEGLIEFYREQGLVHEVEGVGDIEAIYARIKETLQGTS